MSSSAIAAGAPVLHRSSESGASGSPSGTCQQCASGRGRRAIGPRRATGNRVGAVARASHERDGEAAVGGGVQRSVGGGPAVAAAPVGIRGIIGALRLAASRSAAHRTSATNPTAFGGTVAGLPAGMGMPRIATAAPQDVITGQSSTVAVEWVENLTGALAIYGIGGSNSQATRADALRTHAAGELDSQLRGLGHRLRAIREVEQIAAVRRVGDLIQEYVRQAESAAEHTHGDVGAARRGAQREAAALLRQYHVTSETRVPARFSLRVDVESAPVVVR